MSTQCPFLPPEIVLMVLASPNLTITDILTCTRVNREWYGLIYGTNELRTKLFLPLRTASGDMTDVHDLHYTWLVTASIVVDDNPKEPRQPSTSTSVHIREAEVHIHPLLQLYSFETFYVSDVFSVSYRLLRKLHQWHEQRSTSWSEMCITSPLIRHIHLIVQQSRCDDKSRLDYCIHTIENRTGVTIGDLYSAMWSTNLKCNMGLIANDKSCMGPAYPYTGEQEACLYYNTIGTQDRAWAKVASATAEYELLEGRPFESSDEGMRDLIPNVVIKVTSDIEEPEMAIQEEEVGFVRDAEWYRRQTEKHTRETKVYQALASAWQAREKALMAGNTRVLRAHELARHSQGN
jgi:hypothetical protein